MTNEKELSPEKLKALVKSSPYKVSYLAEECGIAPGTLANILSGGQKASLPVIKLLAQKLGVSEESLLETESE